MCSRVYEYWQAAVKQTLQWRMTKTITGESKDTGNSQKKTERQLWFIRIKNILNKHWPHMPTTWVDAMNYILISPHLADQLCVPDLDRKR